MSAKRLNKRQAREQQELEQLATEQAGPSASATQPDAEDSASDGEEDQVATRAQPSSSIFAALGGEEEEDLDDVESDEEDANIGTTAAASASASGKKKKNKKKNKKKKKPAEAADGLVVGQEGSGVSIPDAGSKKATPKKKVPADSLEKDLSKMSMDDFDSLLASQPHLATQGGAGPGSSQATKATAAKNSPVNALRSSLSLQQNHLDPSVELKRQFGSAAIKVFEAANGGTSSGGGPGGAGGARARMMARNPNLKLRSVLVQPRQDWPPIARTFTGMSGELLDSADVGGKVATWEHTRAYRAAQYEFQQAVASYDPNNIYALFRSYPWHVHLLSSLSDIAKHQGDLGQASDWNARALFAYERTASPVFTSSLTSPQGPIPVDFEKVENRGLYLAAHRMIAFLGRRGTWRTALEYAKFLLGLDIKDPHACLLWVDFLAIKSKQHKWLVEDFLPRARKVRDLNWAGGIEFAEALGLRSLEKESGDKTGSRSTPALQSAIRNHAYLLPALYSKLSLSLPSGMADHPAVNATLVASDEDASLREIIASVYAARNESLWKDNDVKEWLVSNVKKVWESGNLERQNAPSKMSTQDRWSLYRHVLVSDMPDALRQSLTSLIPKDITSNASNLDAFDPLPPTSENATRIDDEYFAVLYRTGNVASQRQQQQGQMDERGMMQRLWDLFQRGGLDLGGEGAEGPQGEQQRLMAQQLARAFQEARAGGAFEEEAGYEDVGGEEQREEDEEDEEEDVPGGWGAAR